MTKSKQVATKLIQKKAQAPNKKFQATSHQIAMNLC